MSGPSTPKMAKEPLLAIIAVSVFLIGSFLAYSSFGKISKLDRAIKIKNRELQRMDQSISIDELEAKLDAISGWLDDDHAVNAARDLIEAHGFSGIELGTAIQEYIHAFNAEIRSEGIESNDKNLGFDDYAREVAILNDANSIKIPSVELGMLQTLLPVIIESQPIAIEQIKRLSESESLPGGQVVDPETGYLIEGPEKIVNRYKVCVVFDAYTRSLRHVMNTLAEDSALVLTDLSVVKSERSEPDHLSEFLEQGRSQNQGKSQSKTGSSSPFAQYIQVEPEQEEATETKPLIGEVVSQFSMTFELHPGGVQ